MRTFNKAKAFWAVSGLALVSGLSHGASAQDATLAQSTVAVGALAASDVDAVVVTGSRALGRTVLTSPAPIDVVSAEDLKVANRSNLLDALNSTLPSFNLPAVATPDIGSMIRAGQLRGLNPDQTLVLVNGKRRHSTAFLGAGGFSASAPADLSLIPAASIDHIEVLRDGASAIYGSDAIAGVINIITKSRDHGGEISIRAGQFYEGDGQTESVQFNVGTKLGGTGHLNISGELDRQEGTVRNFAVPSNYLYYFPRNAAGQLVVPSGTGQLLPAGATADPREASRDPVAWKNTGQPAFLLGSVAIDAGAPIGDHAEVYAFGTYSYRRADSPQNFRTPTRDTDIRAIYPDGFAPVEQIRENDFSINGGVKGDALAGWRWDLSSTFGQDQVDAYARNSVNPTLGTASPTTFYDGRLTYSSFTTNLDLNRSVQAVVPVDLSFGGEFRHETYAISPGEPASYIDGGVPILDGPNAGKPQVGAAGAQGLPGFRPEDQVHASRDSYSFYGGAGFHVTSAWLIDLAGRYEHYSDFGSKVTGRLSTRYDFTNWLAVRGTISNGFHAPALATEYYKNTANINTYQQHALQVGSPQAIALGAQPLKPETSKNYSLGFIVSPLPKVHLTVDAYQIDVKNRIAQSTTIRDAIYPGSGVLVQAAGFAPADGVSYFINAADTRTKGVDITAETTTNFDRFGTFRWSVGLNFNKTELTNIAATPAALARFNIPVFSVANQYAVTYLSPRSKQTFDIDWSLGPWSINLRQTHYGEVKRPGTPTAVATSGPYAGLTSIDNKVAAIWVTDFSIGYDFNEHIGLAVNANNLFNARPSKTPAPLLAANQTASYNNFGPVGSGGGFYSAKVTYKF